MFAIEKCNKYFESRLLNGGIDKDWHGLW
jgi:hypothetical protein